MLSAIVIASVTHVGGAASAASLRNDLTRAGRIDDADFNEAYAVARLTPGTNLLALYALLGFHVASWRGALVAVTVGTVLSALIATAIAAVYVEHADKPLVAAAMAGARAGALAVFVWAVVRLLRPVLKDHTTRGVSFAVGLAAIAAAEWFGPFLLILAGGIAGAMFFKRQT